MPLLIPIVAGLALTGCVAAWAHYAASNRWSYRTTYVYRPAGPSPGGADAARAQLRTFIDELRDPQQARWHLDQLQVSGRQLSVLLQGFVRADPTLVHDPLWRELYRQLTKTGIRGATVARWLAEGALLALRVPPHPVRARLSRLLPAGRTAVTVAVRTGTDPSVVALLGPAEPTTHPDVHLVRVPDWAATQLLARPDRAGLLPDASDDTTAQLALTLWAEAPAGAEAQTLDGAVALARQLAVA